MNNKTRAAKKSVWLKMFLAVAMFFVMFASMFFVSCGEADDVIINYTDALGKKRASIVTSGATFAELNAKEISGYEFNG